MPKSSGASRSLSLSGDFSRPETINSASARSCRLAPAPAVPRPAPVGHLDWLTVRDPGEVAAGVLPQFTHPDPFHELHSSTLGAAVR